jgi:Integrase core domain
MAVTWVDDQEFYQPLDKDGITDDIHLFNEKLREWEDYYNYHRPHGALDGQTPVRTAGRQDESGSVTGALGTYRSEPPHVRVADDLPDRHRGVASAGRSCSSTPAYLY